MEEFRKQQKDTTLWDRDWINGNTVKGKKREERVIKFYNCWFFLEYRTRLSVHEQSKAVLEFAISNDTEFLSRCNIMDYSLLVGIDQDKYEMTVGIVG